MSTTQFRPTFSLPTNNRPLEVIGAVKRLVESLPLEYQGQFTNEHAMISIVDSKRHFWPPCLQLELRQNDQQREIFGRFSLGCQKFEVADNSACATFAPLAPGIRTNSDRHFIQLSPNSRREGE